MGIPMTQIPDILLVPGQYQEIDNSLAGAQGEIKKVLLAGYKMKEGTAPAGKPVQVLSEDKTDGRRVAQFPCRTLPRSFYQGKTMVSGF